MKLLSLCCVLLLQVWLAWLCLLLSRLLPTPTLELRASNKHAVHNAMLLGDTTVADVPCACCCLCAVLFARRYRCVLCAVVAAQDAMDTFKLETISFQPRVALLHDFLGERECRVLLELGEKHRVENDSSSAVQLPQGVFGSLVVSFRFVSLRRFTLFASSVHWLVRVD